MTNPYAAPTPDSNQGPDSWASAQAADAAQQAQQAASYPQAPQPQADDQNSSWSSIQPQDVSPGYQQNPYQSGYNPTGDPQGAYYAGAQAGAYGQPMYQPQPVMVNGQIVDPAKLRSDSTIALVLGILGLVFIGLLGSIPAWIWGDRLIKRAQAAGIPADVVSNAKAGRVLGIIGTALWVVIAIFFLVIFIIMMIAVANDPANFSMITGII